MCEKMMANNQRLVCSTILTCSACSTLVDWQSDLLKNNNDRLHSILGEATELNRQPTVAKIKLLLDDSGEIFKNQYNQGIVCTL